MLKYIYEGLCCRQGIFDERVLGKDGSSRSLSDIAGTFVVPHHGVSDDISVGQAGFHSRCEAGSFEVIQVVAESANPLRDWDGSIPSVQTWPILCRCLSNMFHPPFYGFTKWPTILPTVDLNSVLKIDSSTRDVVRG